MDSAFIVSEQKHHEALAALLGRCGYSAQFAQSAGEARRRLLETDFQLIVINTPLSDEFGRDLALFCAENTDTGVIMLVAAAQADRVSAGVEPYGVFVQEKPLSHAALSQAVKLIRASRRRIILLQKKNRRLLQQLDDVRLSCRAKCLLVQRFQMTEEEAHHYIEHHAMDLRISRRDAVLDLLKRCGE